MLGCYTELEGVGEVAEERGVEVDEVSGVEKTSLAPGGAKSQWGCGLDGQHYDSIMSGPTN